jgi:hypothetical protein
LGKDLWGRVFSKTLLEDGTKVFGERVDIAVKKGGKWVR